MLYTRDARFVWAGRPVLSLLSAMFMSGALLGGGACKKEVADPGADKPAGLPAQTGEAVKAVAPPSGTPPTGTPQNQEPNQEGGGEAEVVPEPPAAAESVSGSIAIAQANKKAVENGATMWLIVRAGGGKGGPPLAIQRMTVAEFPVEFLVSGRDAMIKGIPFAGEVDISVRVDRDGNPMTHSKGEVYGEVTGVKVGASGVVINLDQVQAEDVMLGGARPMGAKPPGHP